jgi:molybdenum-dependent DNA-binding transcriptional regulator ModE
VNLILYPKLGTRSKRALVRTNRRGFKKAGTHSYSPKGTLLLRLASETGMTIDQVYSQLQKERAYLLKQNALT